jgi:hypothetical protein
MLKSPEYPKSPKFPKSLASPCVSCVSVSPVSEGQGLDRELEKELEGLATRTACTHPFKPVTRSGDRERFELARHVRAVEERIGRELTVDELTPALDQWYWLSRPFLDPAKTREDYWALFFSELGKVRVPAGEGDTLNKVLEIVSKLSVLQLPEIPGYADAPESWRRIAALHRELSRLCANGTYFLSYRDAAKVCDGLSHQLAHAITSALASTRFSVIEIVSKGKAGLNSGKAAEFRYLLPQNATGAEEDDGGMSFSTTG